MEDAFAPVAKGTPKLLGFRIERIWAFIASADDGDEGIIGTMAPSGEWMPLLAADPTRLTALRPIAEGIARDSGQKVRLVLFTQREEVEEIG